MLSRIKNHSALPVILLVSISFIWGSSFILIKKGLNAFDPAQLGTLRIVFACLVLLPVALKNLSLYKVNWKKFVFFGFIANLIPAILFATAQTKLNSSITGILNSVTPIFTFLIGIFFFSTKVKPLQFVGLIIGFVGSAALSFVNNSGALGSFNYYALFVIAATICYGISGNFVKVYLSKVNSLLITSMALLSVGPVALIYLLTTDFVTVLTTHPDGWSSLIYIFILGAVGTAFALIFFNKLIQMTSAVFASSVTFLIPLFALCWGIIDGEAVSIYHGLGMVTIIAGVYIINKSK